MQILVIILHQANTSFATDIYLFYIIGVRKKTLYTMSYVPKYCCERYHKCLIFCDPFRFWKFFVRWVGLHEHQVSCSQATLQRLCLIPRYNDATTVIRGLLILWILRFLINVHRYWQTILIIPILWVYAWHIGDI